jgi:DNA polymerase elongation subunit (family B)
MTIKEAEKLVTRICIILGFSIKKLKSKSRESELVLQKRAFMKLLSDTGMTTKNVGLVFDKDHSSVIFNNRRHKDLLYIKDKIYIDVFEKIKKEFILRKESIDDVVESLLEILSNENKLRHDTIIETTKENKKLEKEIQYLKDQINILNK